MADLWDGSLFEDNKPRKVGLPPFSERSFGMGRAIAPAFLTMLNRLGNVNDPSSIPDIIGPAWVYPILVTETLCSNLLSNDRLRWLAEDRLRLPKGGLLEACTSVQDALLNLEFLLHAICSDMMPVSMKWFGDALRNRLSMLLFNYISLTEHLAHPSERLNTTGDVRRRLWLLVPESMKEHVLFEEPRIAAFRNFWVLQATRSVMMGLGNEHSFLKERVEIDGAYALSYDVSIPETALCRISILLGLTRDIHVRVQFDEHVPEEDIPLLGLYYLGVLERKIGMVIRDIIRIWERFLEHPETPWLIDPKNFEAAWRGWLDHPNFKRFLCGNQYLRRALRDVNVSSEEVDTLKRRLDKEILRHLAPGDLLILRDIDAQTDELWNTLRRSMEDWPTVAEEWIRRTRYPAWKTSDSKYLEEDILSSGNEQRNVRRTLTHILFKRRTGRELPRTFLTSVTSCLRVS